MIGVTFIMEQEQLFSWERGTRTIQCYYTEGHYTEKHFESQKNAIANWKGSRVCLQITHIKKDSTRKIDFSKYSN